jgi:long-chain acyl-CoA synthetase
LNLLDSDVPALRPTVTMAVPDVLRLMHRKVLADVKSKGAVSKFVFNRALGSQSNLKGASASKMPGSTRVLEKLHQRLFGGRIRLIFSSGNPLAPPLQSNLSSICGCPILQIYSLAESAGAAMVTPVCLRGAAGNVGAPLPSVEVKLVDTTHLKARDKYPSTLGEFAKQSTFRGNFDRQQAGANLPRGQICLRGPSVSPGYFKDRVETEKAWDEMGWLHTGDAGMWNSDGSMSFLNQFDNNFRMAHEDDGAFSIISIQA